MMVVDGVNVLGYLELDTNNDWIFVQRDSMGRIVDTMPVPDLIYTWKHRIQESNLQVRWGEEAVTPIEIA